MNDQRETLAVLLSNSKRDLETNIKMTFAYILSIAFLFMIIFLFTLLIFLLKYQENTENYEYNLGNDALIPASY